MESRWRSFWDNCLRNGYVRKMQKQPLGARAGLLRFTEDGASPRLGSGLMGEGGSATCPTVLSPTTPGLFMGTDGTPRSHPQFSELKWGNASAQPDSCHPLPSPQTHTRWVSWPFAPAAPLCSYVLD